jgi:hypothetical protein
LRITLFNKTAVSCKDNLDPGSEACAGLRQGVPGEGPPSLIFWIRSFDLLPEFAWTLNSETPHKKIVKRDTVRGDGRPDLLYPHLRKPILEPVLHPFAVLGMSAALLEDVMVIYSYLVHPSTLSSHICSGNVHLLHPGWGGTCRGPR